MRAVDRTMNKAITDRFFQSATLLVAQEGQPLLYRAYGKATLDSVFDLASLTKVLATSAVAMQLVKSGALAVERPVRDWLPEVTSNLGEQPLSLLLDHRSGLPAWTPFYEDPGLMRLKSATGRKAAIRRQIATAPLKTRPGRETVYSDLGFIALEWVLERAGGATLDRLFQQLIARPLNLTRTRFFKIGEKPPRWPLVPTEKCPWRKQRLLGQVHDDNCYVMGGVAGHAGLFSTTHDVHRIANELFSAHVGRASIFDAAVVRKFWNHKRRDRRPLRALGWDRPTNAGAPSSSGRHFSDRTVGHLGFTGTSLWIDLERALWVVLLSNRVYYGREPNPMKQFRPKIHDQILSAWRER